MMQAEVQFLVPLYTKNIEGLVEKLNLVDEVMDYVSMNHTESPNGMVQSLPYLHKKENIVELNREIIECIEYISLNFTKYESKYKVDITSMWGNVQKPGAFFNKHYHRNNIYSGILYLNDSGEDVFPPTKFFSPLVRDFGPSVKETNVFNAASSERSFEKGVLVIFPAWLEHDVGINLTPNNRLTISFNVMLRGDFDSPDSLQSVRF